MIFYIHYDYSLGKLSDVSNNDNSVEIQFLCESYNHKEIVKKIIDWLKKEKQPINIETTANTVKSVNGFYIGYWTPITLTELGYNAEDLVTTNN